MCFQAGGGVGFLGRALEDKMEWGISLDNMPVAMIMVAWRMSMTGVLG